MLILKTTKMKMDLPLIKIILPILLFFIALIPIFIKSETIYQNIPIKILITIILLIITIINIKIIITDNNEMKRQEKEKKELIKLTSELDNYINNIEINLKLDKSYKVKELNPIYFGYEFRVYEKDIDITEVLVTNNLLKKNNITLLSYKIYDAKRGGKDINSTLYGKWISIINRLYTKIYFPPQKYTLRDLNKGMLMVYLTDNLINKVRTISLSVNGWILINEKISSDNWERINDITKVGGWGNYGLEMKTYYRINPSYTQSFNYHPWQIDLFNKKIKKIEK